jgi:two-component system, chemotaxis family, response regulator Rcp1
MDGREVLAEMVADETLNAIPVVVLTTSAQDEEVLKMYKMRCNSYIIKPIDFDQFLYVVRSIAEYWFTVVVLPVGKPTNKASHVGA